MRNNDVVAAIQRWVEEGQAPQHILATKFEGDDPHSKVVRARPLRVYRLPLNGPARVQETIRLPSCAQIREAANCRLGRVCNISFNRL